MSVLFYPESIRILGSDANGNNVMLCEMAVDDIANLPAANAFISDGYVLSMGCVATAINDNSKHRLNGSGNWIQIAAGTSTYTRAEIDAILSAIDEENTSQQAEINYSINQGVKNLIDLNPNTYTSGNVVVKLNDDGTVSVSLSSGSTANTTFSRAIKTITNLRGMDLILNGSPSGGNYSSGYALYISDDGMTKEKDEGNGVLVPKNTTVTTSYLALIVRSGTAISGTLTFKPMIRPAAITDPTYVPYAPTNRQLYEMILQLQGG